MPKYWQNEIIREQHQRQRGHCWIAFRKPCPIDPVQIAVWVGEMLGKPAKVEEELAEILVDCREENIRENILQLHNEKYEGEHFKYILI